MFAIYISLLHHLIWLCLLFKVQCFLSFCVSLSLLEIWIFKKMSCFEEPGAHYQPLGRAVCGVPAKEENWEAS